MADYRSTYELWARSVPAADPLSKELKDLAGNESELKERFSADLQFGTAGLRGIVGAGTNCMNAYTVARATRGIADYICDAGEDAKKRGVIIAHDPRHFSREFSQLAAVLLAERGIHVYVFPDLRPTPELAFLIRRMNTVSGINITASHNPREYNGYKAYWEDGCQVSAAVADGMMEKIASHDYFEGSRGGKAPLDMAAGAYEALLEEGKITLLGQKEDRMYLDTVEGLAIHEGGDLDTSIPIVYTPLNGAGSVPFSAMMKDRGFTNFQIVPAQADPDPDFTTVGYPNPEDPKAFRLSEELGRKIGAELLMATDPDADRFAIELLSGDGSYVPLNGNQTGYLLVNYILEGRRDAGTLPTNGAMVTSIVTSTMSTVMAEAYGVRMFEALTGFKNICGRIPFLEKNGFEYLFGYEESVGYAACEQIRDKDGISAGMLVAEAAAYYRKQGLTLWQELEKLYEQYGYYAEDEPNIVLKGIEGAGRIKRMMAQVRSEYSPLAKTARSADQAGSVSSPQDFAAFPAGSAHLAQASVSAMDAGSVAGFKIVQVIDYLKGYEDVPASNVLRFFLDNGSWFAIRPSGTEPKIKFYFYSCQGSHEEAVSVNSKIRDAVLAHVNSFE